MVCNFKSRIDTFLTRSESPKGWKCHIFMRTYWRTTIKLDIRLLFTHCTVSTPWSIWGYACYCGRSLVDTKQVLEPSSLLYFIVCHFVSTSDWERVELPIIQCIELSWVTLAYFMLLQLWRRELHELSPARLDPYIPMLGPFVSGLRPCIPILDPYIPM